MSHLDHKQGDLFPGPEIGGRKIHPYKANWYKQKVIPSAVELINDLESAGEMPSVAAGHARNALLLALHKLESK